MLPRKKIFKLLFMLILSLFPYDGLCDETIICWPDTVPGQHGPYRHWKLDKVHGGFRQCHVYEYATHGKIDSNRKALIANLKFNENGDIIERTEFTFFKEYGGKTYYYYDNDGKLKEKILYHLPSNWKYSYTYDSLGRKTLEHSISPDKDTSIQEYYYKNDEKGNQIEYGSNDLKDSIYFFKNISYYNQNGVKIKDSANLSNLLFVTINYENGKPFSEITRYFDNSSIILDGSNWSDSYDPFNETFTIDTIYVITEIKLTEYDDSLQKIKEIITDSIGNILNTTHFDYDDDGNLIREKYLKNHRDSLSLLISKYFFYDDKDRVIREKRSDLKSPFTFDINKEYDSLDNCIKESTTIENTSILFSDSTDYKYDISGNILEKNGNGTGTLYEYTVYEYNPEGKIISESLYDYGYHNYILSLYLKEGIKYSYNKQGRLSEKIKNNMDSILWQNNYTYDSLGNITGESSGRGDYHYRDSNLYINNTLTETIRSYSSGMNKKYIYNKNGQLLAKGKLKNGVFEPEVTNDYNEEGRLTRKMYYLPLLLLIHKYQYDSNGNIIREEYEGHTNDENLTTFYKYDQYGNMIEEYTIYKNHFHNRDKRVIYEFTR